MITAIITLVIVAYLIGRYHNELSGKCKYCGKQYDERSYKKAICTNPDCTNYYLKGKTI